MGYHFPEKQNIFFLIMVNYAFFSFILFSYCYITKYPKSKCPKATNNLYLYNFCWLRIMVQLS